MVNWTIDVIMVPVLATLLAPCVGTIVPAWRRGVFTGGHLFSLGLALLVWRLAPLQTVVDMRAGPLNVQFELGVTNDTGLGLVLVALLFLVISTFSRGYVQGARHGAAFLALLLLGQAAVTLVLEANDLFALYSGLLVFSIVLTSLIGLDFAAVGERAALRVFATLEVPSTLALVGFWLIATRAGTASLVRLSLAPPVWSEPGAMISFVPIMVALLARSGIFPVQNWAVVGCRATTAPTAIVVAGVALPLGALVLVRLIGVILPASGPWLTLLALLGASTAVVAGASALQERSALGWLGNLAVGQIGLVIVGFAVYSSGSRAAGQLGLIGAILGVVLSGMGVGIAVRAAQHPRVAGLAQQPMPWLGRVALGLGLFALVPLPPFPGFTARWLILVTLLQNPAPWAALVAVLDVLGTLLLAAAVWKVILDPAEALNGEFAAESATYRAPPVSLVQSSGTARHGAKSDWEIPSVLAGSLIVTGILSITQPLWLPLPPAELGGWAGYAALVLLGLAVGGGVAWHTTVTAPAWLNWLGWAISWGNRRLRLGQLCDPYVVIGGSLMAAGQLSAGILNQTLGRLARSR